MPISRRLRFEILRRDGHTCRYCGRRAPDVQLEIDHVIPTALGGSDEPSNLVTACTDCNRGKGSIPADAPVVEDVERSALRWRQAMDEAFRVHMAERELLDSLADEFKAHWDSYTFTVSGDPVPIDADWQPSVERFLALGLPLEELLRFVDVAMQSRRVENAFRYFCKIAWNTLTDLQEDARRILESDG